MTRTADRTHAWVVDYSAARAQAIRWLGDRYLLAKPINAGRYRQPGAGSALVQPARVAPPAAAEHEQSGARQSRLPTA